MVDCTAYTVIAVFIAFSYVGFIYAFDHGKENKSHFNSFKKRFAAVVCNNIIAIFLTYIILKKNYDSPFKLMGFHYDGFISAAIIPSFLTTCAYFGTIVEFLTEKVWKEFYWKRFWNLLWFKYSFIGPITEEIAFRSCCAVLIKHCYGWNCAVFFLPLFFGLSHFHHIFDDLKSGYLLAEAMCHIGYQILYSYLFGIYATYLFFRTEHIIAPILSHSICNNFGLPTLLLINQNFSSKKRIVVIFSNLIGFGTWLFFLKPLTEPFLYK